MDKHKATKLISAPDLNRLEKEINEFLSSIPSDNLQDIKLLANPNNTDFIALVIFEIS